MSTTLHFLRSPHALNSMLEGFYHTCSIGMRITICCSGILSPRLKAICTFLLSWSSAFSSQTNRTNYQPSIMLPPRASVSLIFVKHPVSSSDMIVHPGLKPTIWLMLARMVWGRLLIPPFESKMMFFDIFDLCKFTALRTMLSPWMWISCSDNQSAIPSNPVANMIKSLCNWRS